jgi:hypothetical protein
MLYGLSRVCDPVIDPITRSIEPIPQEQPDPEVQVQQRDRRLNYQDARDDGGIHVRILSPDYY